MNIVADSPEKEGRTKCVSILSDTGEHHLSVQSAKRRDQGMCGLHEWIFMHSGAKKTQEAADITPGGKIAGPPSIWNLSVCHQTLPLRHDTIVVYRSWHLISFSCSSSGQTHRPPLCPPAARDPLRIPNAPPRVVNNRHLVQPALAAMILRRSELATRIN